MHFTSRLIFFGKLRVRRATFATFTTQMSRAEIWPDPQMEKIFWHINTHIFVALITFISFLRFIKVLRMSEFTVCESIWTPSRVFMQRLYLWTFIETVVWVFLEFDCIHIDHSIVFTGNGNWIYMIHYAENLKERLKS